MTIEPIQKCVSLEYEVVSEPLHIGEEHCVRQVWVCCCREGLSVGSLIEPAGPKLDLASKVDRTQS